MTAPDVPFTQPLQDEAPVVSVVMGSDSDWPTMEAAAQARASLGREIHAEAWARMIVDFLHLAAADRTAP